MPVQDLEPLLRQLQTVFVFLAVVVKPDDLADEIISLAEFLRALQFARLFGANPEKNLAGVQLVQEQSSPRQNVRPIVSEGLLFLLGHGDGLAQQFPGPCRVLDKRLDLAKDRVVSGDLVQSQCFAAQARIFIGRLNAQA